MRSEFTAKTKEQAWYRCKGVCEGLCGVFLQPGKYEFHHLIPDALGGDNSLANCRVLCIACHDRSTRKVDVPAIAKMKRVRRLHRGIKKVGRPIPGSKRSPWQKKMDGTVVRRR